MSAYTKLEPVLRDVLLSIQPTGDDWTVRQQVIEELRAVVGSVKNLEGVTVEPFGSFVSNLFTRSGDLDISLNLPNSWYARTAGKRRAQKLLRDLHAALRKTCGWYQLQIIFNARVPILKFVNREISCDISIDNLKGLMKSKCLSWISEIDGRFRELVLLVKEWAKAHDINNPKTGSLNSYSYSLLVIFHFQTCVPAILPPLKEIYPANMVDNLSGMRDVVEKNIEKICASSIARYKSNCRGRVNKSSLSELFGSFLAKFSDINLRASDLVICPFTGEWEHKSTRMGWQTKAYALFIEDPFEQPENSARAVSSGHLTKISQVFASSHHSHVSGNLNWTSIIAAGSRPQTMMPNAAVCRPQTTMPVARRQYQSPDFSTGGHSMPRWQPSPHVRAAQSAPLYQQFHNMSLQSQPSTVTMQRTGQRFARLIRSQDQGQRVWRPRGNDGRE